MLILLRINHMRNRALGITFTLLVTCLATLASGTLSLVLCHPALAQAKEKVTQGKRAAKPKAPKAARATPRKAAPKKPHPTRLRKTKRLKPLVIKPGAAPAVDTGPHGFRITQVPGQSGKLALSFYSKDPQLALNTEKSILVQLYADEPVELQPFLLTKGNWPKKSDRVQVKYSGGKRGATYEIRGEAAYMVCHRKTKTCTQHKTKFTHPLQL